MISIKWPESIEAEIGGILSEVACTQSSKITDIDGYDIGEILDSIIKKLPELEKSILEGEQESPEESDEESVNKSNGSSSNVAGVNGQCGLPQIASGIYINTFPFGNATSEIFDKALFVYHEKQGERAYKKLLTEVAKYAEKIVTSSNDSNKIGTRRKSIFILTDIWKESMEEGLTTKVASFYFKRDIVVNVLFLKENYFFQSKAKWNKLPYFMQNRWYGPEIDMCCYNNVLLPRDEYEDLIVNRVMYKGSDFNVLISMYELLNSYSIHRMNFMYDYYDHYYSGSLFNNPTEYKAFVEKIANKIDADYGRIVIDKSDGEIYMIKEKDYKEFISSVIPLLEGIKAHSNSSGRGKSYCEISIFGYELKGNIKTDELLSSLNSAFTKLIAATIS